MIITAKNFDDIPYILPYVRYVNHDKYDSPWQEPGRTIPDYEFILITCGEGEFVIDNEVYRVSPGSLILHKPGVWHHAHSVILPFHYICVHFDLFCLKLDGPIDYKPLSPVNLFPQHPFGFSMLEKLNFEKAILDFPTIYKVKNIVIIDEFNKLVHELEAKQTGWRESCMSIFKDIYIGLLREIDETGTSPSKCTELNDEVIQEAVRFIQDNYSQRINVKTLAEMAHLNTDYFSKIFKIRIGVSPQQYIQHCRILNAMRMLRDPGNKVEWIALKCGFNSIHHFSSMFKKYVKTTPSGYQQKYMSR